jgi:hypothetical protein
LVRGKFLKEGNMRVISLLAAGLAISVNPGLAATHTQVFECPAGGSLWFRLRGGDVHIKRGTDPDHIVLRYTPDPKKPDEEKKVQIRSYVHGSQVRLEIKAPLSLSVDAQIEVPSPISLEVSMTGGDLTVKGVDGDKKLELFAGDLKVDVGTLEKLRNAEVSVRVGDVDVPPVGQVRGWLGHTWRYQGNGQYQLYAHTSFGDASLLAK